jgi:hypothetical protein
LAVAEGSVREALVIDTAGAILGSAYSTSTRTWHAIVWVP